MLYMYIYIYTTRIHTFIHAYIHGFGSSWHMQTFWRTFFQHCMKRQAQCEVNSRLQTFLHISMYILVHSIPDAFRLLRHRRACTSRRLILRVDWRQPDNRPLSSLNLLKLQSWPVCKCKLFVLQRIPFSNTLNVSNTVDTLTKLMAQ